jgi:hypothetical protein
MRTRNQSTALKFHVSALANVKCEKLDICENIQRKCLINMALSIQEAWAVVETTCKETSCLNSSFHGLRVAPCNGPTSVGTAFPVSK